MKPGRRLLFVPILTDIVCGTLPARAEVDMMKATLACKGDVFRLCADDVPDQAAIIACMRRNHSELSTQCATVFDAGTHAPPAAPHAPP